MRNPSPVLIGELTNSGALPSLELTARFAGARQRIIAHNIANLSTPDFQPLDVSTSDFQKALSKAIDTRRSVTGESAPLPFQSTNQVRVAPDGTMTLTPGQPSGNILFHDRNNRDLEHMMADMTENQAVFRTSIELLRSRYGILQTAISERV